MANTKSAEKQMRSSLRKQAHNRSVKSRLNTLEKKYLSLLGQGKNEEAARAFREVSSAFDKAAKTGVIHPRRASRKKARLSTRYNAATAAGAAVPK